MLLKPRKNLMGQGDQRMLIYAALFLVCSLLSALGIGIVAVLAFFPAVMAVELASRWGQHRDQKYHRHL